MAVKCVLGCGHVCPEHSEFDICEWCRAQICAATKDKSEEDLKARGVQIDVAKARNIEALSRGPNSYMEQLLTKRKLRSQQEQQRHGKQRGSRIRTTRARA